MKSCYMTQRAQPSVLWWPGAGEGGGGRQAQEGGHTYILKADSRCTAETNTTFKSNYPITNKLKK